MGRRSGWAKVQLECKVPPPPNKERGVPGEQVKRSVLYRSLAKFPLGYMKTDGQDCNTGSVLPHGSVTLGEERKV